MAGTRQLKHRAVKDGKGQSPILPVSSSSQAPVSVMSPDTAAKSRRTPSFVSQKWCTKQSFLILIIGALLGYIAVPLVLVETSSFTQQHGDGFSSKLAKGSSDKNNIQMRLIEDQHILSRQSMPTDRSPNIMETALLSDHERKKIVVTGGAGFVGSHLVDKLMMQGHEVTVLDNFFTGQKKNVAHWFHHPNFK
ncbi:MAG: hypothetical protein SGILL_004765 [Bacillariaceae sp.]